MDEKYHEWFWQTITKQGGKNKPQSYTNMFHTNKKFPSLEGGKYHKSGGIWTLKHEIISLKLY